jgi:hypothetical protein
MDGKKPRLVTKPMVDTMLDCRVPLARDQGHALVTIDISFSTSFLQGKIMGFRKCLLDMVVIVVEAHRIVMLIPLFSCILM